MLINVSYFAQAAAAIGSDREEIEAEEKARAASEAEREAMPELPSPSDMPKTPEPLPAPSSLGGLADRAGVDVPEGGIAEPEGEGLQSLRERTEDVSEDIEESEAALAEEQEESPPSPSIEVREDA